MVFRQRFQRQPQMIYHAEYVWRDDDRRGAQGEQQIARIEICSDGTEQAAGAFHQRHVEIFSRRAEVRQHLC